MSVKRSHEEAMRVADTLRMMLDNLKCAVCLEPLRNPKNTRCGHTFCQLCINQIVKDKNATCPLCNERVSRRGMTENTKIESLVHALNAMISNANKDLADSGIEDVFLLSKPRRPSSKESFSPSKAPTASAAPQPRRHTRITTWLEQVGPCQPSQESSSSMLEEEPAPNNDSDSEMVSVSQINPDQNDTSCVSRSKPLSAHIEEDDAGNESRSKVAMLRTKSLASKKTGSSKMKQNPLRGYISPAKQVCKPGPSLGLRRNKNLQPIVSGTVDVFNLEKENTSNPHVTRSPGWSRLKEMKKEFHSKTVVLKSTNSKGNRSPLPAIEDSGSGEEEPCLNLSLSSPMLKEKAMMNDIVNTLESELEIFERSLQTEIRNTENKVSLSMKVPQIKSKQIPICVDGCKISCSKPLVQFLKLGSVVTKKVPSVPIYLKGSLEHLHCIDISSFSYRLLSDAQTQTEVETGFKMPENPKAVASVKSSHQSFVSPTSQIVQCKGRRSYEKNTDHDIDLMDAETVVLSQPALSEIGESQITVINSPPLLDVEAAETHCPDSQESQKSLSIICSSDAVATNAIPDEPKETQHSASVIFSEDKEGPQKRSNFETTSHVIPQVDLDDSCSSIISDRKPKRGRALSCSSDSDSDIGMSKIKIKKKNRKEVLSDNEDSCPNTLHITAGDTMEILANIEAQLEETTQNSPPEWPESKRQSGRSSPNLDTLQVLGDASTTQVDSDGDSEVINPTPQKLSSFTARSATQSDDIVPSSQPPAVLNGPTTLSLLPNCYQDSTVEKVSVSQTRMCESTKATHDLSCNSVNSLPNDRNLSEHCSLKSTQLEEIQIDKEASAPPTDPSLLKPVFVCSSIPQNLAVNIDKLALMVSGEFSSKFTPDTTHVIVRVDADNKADKTFKYLCAVAAGKWVVSYAWVQSCLDAKKLVPEEPFEVLDTSGEPGPRRSREARLSHKKLFEGFEFCCVGDFDDLSKQQLEGLLAQCGASVVSSPTDFSFQDRIIPLTVAQWDDSKEEEYNSWLDRYSTPLIQHDWVLDCIGKFCLTSFSPLLICDASDDVLSSMGFPAHLYEFIDSEQ